MSYLTKSQQQSVSIDCHLDHYQQYLILQVQILKLKLKEEKLRDKQVYQSLKNNISGTEKIVTH